MSRLYVTIDTEMDADEHWKKRSPREFTSITEGIPQLLRPIWDRYNVHPIYYVSPEVVENEECCEILRLEVQRGAIIGAHLHPEYVEPEKYTGESKSAEQFPCYSCSTEIEKEKIKNLTQMIQDKIGVRPIWYRAARFGADHDTFESIAELGYKYDSSLTPQINWRSKRGPDHSKTPLESYPMEAIGIFEYPITILGKRWGILGKVLPDNWLFYRWLRPTHMFLYELKQIIRYTKKHNIQNITMMFHSMEIMINRTPYVRNRWMQKYYLYRLERSIRYATENGYEV